MSKKIPVFEYTIKLGDYEIEVLSTTSNRSYNDDWYQEETPIGYLTLEESEDE